MRTRSLVFTAFLAICLSLIGVSAWAHGGEEHVIGTVAQVSANSIVVKTAAGKMVTVGVVPESKFSKNKAAMKLADLKVGDRVVIHAKEPTEGTYVADTVEFTTPKPAAAKPAAAKNPGNSY